MSDTTFTGNGDGTYNQTTVTYNLDGSTTTTVINSNNGSGTISLDDGMPTAFSAGETPSVDLSGQPQITTPGSASTDNAGGLITTTVLANGVDVVDTSSTGTVLTNTTIVGSVLSGTYTETAITNGDGTTTTAVINSVDGNGTVVVNGNSQSFLYGQVPIVESSGQVEIPALPD